MSVRICRLCGEERNEKTGTCRNGCDCVTARPVGAGFSVKVVGQADDAPARTVAPGGLRRMPTDRTEEGR